MASRSSRSLAAGPLLIPGPHPAHHLLGELAQFSPIELAIAVGVERHGPLDEPVGIVRHPRPARLGWLAKAAGLDGSIDRWAWLSLFHAQGVVQAWVFGLETRPEAFVPPLVSLVVVAVASAVILLLRVDAPARR